MGRLSFHIKDLEYIVIFVMRCNLYGLVEVHQFLTAV